MTRSKILPIALVASLIMIAFASAAWSQVQVRAGKLKDCEPNLEKSVGLQCVVYLRVPPEGGTATTNRFGTFALDRDRPVVIEGILTGVSDDAVTMRNNERVFWINRDQVGVVMFENK